MNFMNKQIFAECGKSKKILQLQVIKDLKTLKGGNSAIFYWIIQYIFQRFSNY